MESRPACSPFSILFYVSRLMRPGSPVTCIERTYYCFIIRFSLSIDLPMVLIRLESDVCVACWGYTFSTAAIASLPPVSRQTCWTAEWRTINDDSWCYMVRDMCTVALNGKWLIVGAAPPSPFSVSLLHGLVLLHLMRICLHQASVFLLSCHETPIFGSSSSWSARFLRLVGAGACLSPMSASIPLFIILYKTRIKISTSFPWCLNSLPLGILAYEEGCVLQDNVERKGTYKKI